MSRNRRIFVLMLAMLLLIGAGEAPLTPSLPVAAQGGGTIDLSLRGLGYADTTLTDIDASFDVFFPSIGGAPGDSTLEFIYAHSNLLNPQLSTASVFVNDVPVWNGQLTDKNAARTIERIAVPADRLRAANNRVSFRFSLRFRDACDGENSAARNAVVFRDTTLRLSPPTMSPAPLLTDFPTHFLSLTRPGTGIVAANLNSEAQPPLAVPVTAAVPPDASIEERSGATTLMASLGNRRGTLPLDPRMVTTPGLAQAAKMSNVLLVAKAAKVPADLLAGAPFTISSEGWKRADGTAIPAGAGVLLMAGAPGDARGRVLIVSGNDDAGIARAVTALSTAGAMDTFAGQSAVITDATFPPAPNGTKISFGDLGFTTAQVTGFGTRDLNVSFISGTISGAATLTVDLANSAVLDGNRSAMTVIVNGQPTGSTRLDGKNGERRLVRFSIPPNVLRAGRNTLRFSFQMQTEEIACQTHLDGTQLFSVLYPETSLTLAPPAKDGGTLTLDAYPVPFAQGDAPLTMIVGDANDLDGMTAALRLAYGTGGAVQRTPATRLLTAADATPPVLGNRSAVAFGLPANNALLQPLTDSLLLTGSNGTVQIRPSTANAPTVGRGIPTAVPISLTAAGNGPVGALQILAAPWDKGATLLIISGTDPQTRLWATDALIRSRFRSREAVITRDPLGALVVGETRPVATPAFATPANVSNGTDLTGTAATTTTTAPKDADTSIGLPRLWVIGVVLVTAAALVFMAATLSLRARRRKR